MRFTVTLTREVLEDLRRLEDFLVEAALAHGDWDLPGRAVDAIRNELCIPETNPYTCRMAQSDPLGRELVTAVRQFGCCGAVRDHQRPRGGAVSAAPAARG